MNKRKRVVPKNKGGGDLSATEESSSSTLSSERSSWATKMNEVFGGEAVEQMKSMASTGPGGWTEAWARKIMEVGEEGEEEVLGCLHRAMREEFGHVTAQTMIEGIRNFVREQEDGRDRGKKEGREERRQQWRRGEEAWESVGREVRNKVTGGARREEGAESAIEGGEATIAEEWGKGGKGVGMSGGSFWRTGQQQWQQEEVEQGAAWQGQREKAEQEAAWQRQQREEAEQEAARRQQRENVEREATRRQQRQQEEAAQQQRQQEEAAQRQRRQQEEAARQQRVEKEEVAKREDQQRRR